MAQTFNQDVLIDGTTDTTQLRVQGSITQTQPLQTWEDSAGNPQIQIAGNGNFQSGDLGISLSAALFTASANLTPTSPQPNRGFHSLGRFTGALTTAITWIVHELELLGHGGVNTLQTALRVKLTNNNTGSLTDAELIAADFQAINQQGASENAIKQITGIHAIVNNAAGGYCGKTVAIEAVIENAPSSALENVSGFELSAPIISGNVDYLYGLLIPDLNHADNNYALHTGSGILHFGDIQELTLQETTPPRNPPSGFVSLYPMILEGSPQLVAKTADGLEHLIGLGGGHEVYVDDILQIQRPKLNFISDRGIRWTPTDDVTNGETQIRALSIQTAVFSFDGPLKIAASPLRLYNKSGSTRVIERVFLSVSTSPTGATIIVDIHKDQTTIFTTQIHRPEIGISDDTGESVAIDTPDWLDGEYLEATIDQIGSIVPGADLCIHIIFS